MEENTRAWLWQLGARVERSTLTADDLHLAHEDHGHGEAENDDALHSDLEDPDEEHSDEDAVVFEEQSFTPFSLSAGFVWEFNEGYNLAASLAHAERAPSAAELFSAGNHIATGTFEAGALFEIHAQEHDSELEYHLITMVKPAKRSPIILT